MDREMEVRHLNKADARIADAERHITAQRFLVERLHAKGLDVLEAERLLAVMHETLAAYHKHRQLILDEIDRIDAGLA